MSVPIDDRVKKLEGRFEKLVSDLNSLNQSIADHVGKLERNSSSLEKRFAKLEKTSTKVAKVADVKVRDKALTDIVDKALAAYDKSKGSK